MNQNLVNALRQVISERGEDILTENSNLLFNLLSDLAPECEKERKRIRLALRCSAMEQLNKIKDEPENSEELFKRSVVFASDENDWNDDVAYDTMLTLFSAMYPDLSAAEIQSSGEAAAENGTAAAVGAVSSSGYEYFDDDEGNDTDRTWALEFEEKDGGYYISKYMAFSYEDEIELPAVYKGKPVIGISDNVFMNSNVDKIIIPDSVVEIGNECFKSSYINEVLLSESVKEIGQSAFAYCNCITNMVLPDQISKIGQNAFSSCEYLSSVNIPKSLSEIEEGVFFGCEALETVDLPQGIKSIAANAFHYSGIRKLIIPKSVDSISFNLICSLESVAIQGKNTEITDFSKQSSKVSIYCLVGSKAFLFAKENGISCCPLKDYQP